MDNQTSAGLTRTQWLICIIASIGFAFDIYELLMLPLIIKPAMAALSAPLVEQMVAAGMPRPEAMAQWLPGGESMCTGRGCSSSSRPSPAASSVCSAAISPTCSAAGAC